MDSTRIHLITYALPAIVNAQLAAEALTLSAFLAQSLDSIKQPQQAVCSLAIQTNTNPQLLLLLARVVTLPVQPAQEDLRFNVFLAVDPCFLILLQALVSRLALMDSTQILPITYVLFATVNAQLAAEVLILSAFLAQCLDSIKQPQQVVFFLVILININLQLRLHFV